MQSVQRYRLTKYSKKHGTEWKHEQHGLRLEVVKDGLTYELLEIRVMQSASTKETLLLADYVSPDLQAKLKLKQSDTAAFSSSLKVAHTVSPATSAGEQDAHFQVNFSGVEDLRTVVEDVSGFIEAHRQRNPSGSIRISLNKHGKQTKGKQREAQQDDGADVGESQMSSRGTPRPPSLDAESQSQASFSQSQKRSQPVVWQSQKKKPKTSTPPVPKWAPPAGSPQVASSSIQVKGSVPAPASADHASQMLQPIRTTSWASTLPSYANPGTSINVLPPRGLLSTDKFSDVSMPGAHRIARAASPERHRPYRAGDPALTSYPHMSPSPATAAAMSPPPAVPTAPAHLSPVGMVPGLRRAEPVLIHDSQTQDMPTPVHARPNQPRLPSALTQVSNFDSESASLSKSVPQEFQMPVVAASAPKPIQISTQDCMTRSIFNESLYTGQRTRQGLSTVHEAADEDQPEATQLSSEATEQSQPFQPQAIQLPHAQASTRMHLRTSLQEREGSPSQVPMMVMQGFRQSQHVPSYLFEDSQDAAQQLLHSDKVIQDVRLAEMGSDGRDRARIAGFEEGASRDVDIDTDTAVPSSAVQEQPLGVEVPPVPPYPAGASAALPRFDASSPRVRPDLANLLTVPPEEGHQSMQVVEEPETRAPTTSSAQADLLPDSAVYSDLFSIPLRPLFRRPSMGEISRHHAYFCDLLSLDSAEDAYSVLLHFYEDPKLLAACEEVMRMQVAIS